MPRVYGAAAVIHLFAVPLLTMRLVAGEWRNRTLPLLLSAPVSTLEIVAGKYLGVTGLVAAMVALNSVMPASLALFTDLDTGALGLAAPGSLLLAAAAAALGLYVSTLTRVPTVAAIGTLGLLLGLLMLGEWGGQHGGLRARILGYPAPSTHLEPFASGLFDTGALAFFGVFTGLFLALAVRRLDNHRLTGQR